MSAATSPSFLKNIDRKMQFGAPGVCPNYGKQPAHMDRDPRSGALSEEGFIDLDSDLDSLRGALDSIRPAEHPARKHCPRPVLTATEYEFYKLLRRAMRNCLVLPKVNLGSLVSPAKELPELERKVLHRQYRRRVVDFVLWDPDTLSVVCLVDLDHTSYEDTPAEFLQQDALAGEAGYATVRLKVLEEYDVDFLRELVLEALDCLSSPERFIERRLRDAPEVQSRPSTSRRIATAFRKPVDFCKRHSRPLLGTGVVSATLLGLSMLGD